MTPEILFLSIEGVKDGNGQEKPAGRLIKIERENGGRRRGRCRRPTPGHQYIWLVLLSMPAANAVPRRHARPRDVSATRPLASVCHVDVWGGVPTLCPRHDRTRSGTQREKRGQGSASGGGGERRRNDTRRSGHHIRDQIGRQWRGEMTAGNIRPLHILRPAAQRG